MQSNFCCTIPDQGSLLPSHPGRSVALISWASPPRNWPYNAQRTPHPMTGLTGKFGWKAASQISQRHCLYIQIYIYIYKPVQSSVFANLNGLQLHCDKKTSGVWSEVIWTRLFASKRMPTSRMINLLVAEFSAPAVQRPNVLLSVVI